MQPEIYSITTGLKQKIPRPVHSSESFLLSYLQGIHLTLSPQNYLARRRSSQGRGKFVTDLLRQRLAGVSEGLQSVCFVAGLWLPVCHFQLRV